MIELAYTSTASWLYSQDNLDGILSASRRNNASAGITGILLHRGMTVLQLLEGPPEAVRELYGKLAQDRRHHSLVLLFERPLQQRVFPEWTMAFEALPESPLPAGAHRLAGNSIELELNLPPERRRLVDLFVQQVR